MASNDDIQIPPLPKAQKKTMTSEQRDRLYFLRESKKAADIQQLQVIKDLEDKDYERICRGLGEQLIDKMMKPQPPPVKEKKSKKKVDTPPESSSESEDDTPVMPAKPLKKKREEKEAIHEIKAKPVYKEPEPEPQEQLPRPDPVRSKYGQRTTPPKDRY